MSCPSKIRPFPNDTELACELDAHVPAGTTAADRDPDAPDFWTHRAVLRDYAYPGSETIVTWKAGDRREFTGDWPGYCRKLGHLQNSMLPAGHHGSCA
jgi:hypothetical protein